LNFRHLSDCREVEDDHRLTLFLIMSVDLDWSKLDAAIADKVRDFLNERFKSLSLPSMLKSIDILSFEFGSITPTIEIQHITDPYPEFYQDNYDDNEDETDSDPPDYSSQQYEDENMEQQRVETERPSRVRMTSYVEAWTPPFFPQGMTVGGRPGQVFAPYFHPTPGIMTSGLSTPTWMPAGLAPRPRSIASSPLDAESVYSTQRPRSVDTSTLNSPRSRSNTIDTTTSSPRHVPPPLLDSFSRPTTAQSTLPEPSSDSLDSDIQIIARITYEGNPRAQIQAELDFNYPSSSFISLPIRLTLTGLSFSGLALIAYIRNRVHFCFLEDDEDDEGWEHMLRDIRLESEIGELGKGVLKNVGKVERFLLEQGRRMISEEFVFPSFYTFIL
jgi:distribution and morphology protein 12